MINQAEQIAGNNGYNKVINRAWIKVSKEKAIVIK